MFAETNFSFAQSTGNVADDARGVDLGHTVGDSYSNVGEESPALLGSFSSNLHAEDDLSMKGSERV